jgi:hypothetical protein
MVVGGSDRGISEEGGGRIVGGRGQESSGVEREQHRSNGEKEKNSNKKLCKVVRRAVTVQKKKVLRR